MEDALKEPEPEPVVGEDVLAERVGRVETGGRGGRRGCGCGVLDRG
jgi:hypothetical protein